MALQELLKQAPEMRWALPCGGIALLAAALAGVLTLLKKHKAAAKALPAALGAVAATLRHNHDSTGTLRQAWTRFLRRLPRDYRRSLTRFDHFLLLGGPSAGHARLLVRHANGLEFMRQLLGNESLDPVLPAAITPGAVALSLPSQVLEDESGAGRETFRRLARAAFASVHPVAVVVVDVGWLKDASHEAVSDFVRVVRDKLSLLTKWRRRSLEVRVALTGLDIVAGADEALKLCQAEGMALHIPPGPTEAEGPASAWLTELATQIPRALVRLGADAFRSYVAFCAGASDVMSKVDKLVHALHVAVGAGVPLISGGIYLSSDAVASPGPMVGRAGHHGMDPLRRHRRQAALGATVVSAALVLMYAVHHSSWQKASEALREFRPEVTPAGGHFDSARRAQIVEFTEDKGAWWARAMPDAFFGKARRELRKKFSDLVRAKVLIRGLEQAWAGSFVDPSTKMTLRWRRSIYYIALIHSDNEDRLGLRGRMDLATKMTQLPEGLLRDYLNNTDSPYLRSLLPLLHDQKSDPRDSIAPWRDLVRDASAAVSDGHIGRQELEKLREQTQWLEKALPRFHDDSITRQLLNDLKNACPPDGRTQCESDMTNYADTVLPRQREERSGVETNKIGPLAHLLDLVQSSQIAPQPATPFLSELVRRLAQVEKPRRSGEMITFKIDDRENSFSVDGWNAAVHRGLLDELLTSFQPSAEAPEEMFFSPENTAHLLSVTWDGGTAFPDGAVLPARLTRSAYESCVRRPLETLRVIGAALGVPQGARDRLNTLLRSATDRYASAYRAEMSQFVKTFSAGIGGREDLELVLGELAAERSAFDRFVQMVDENTNMEAPVSAAQPETAQAKAPGCAPDAGARQAQATGSLPSGSDELSAPFAQISRDFAKWREAHKNLATYKGFAREALRMLSEVPKPAGKGDEEKALPKLLTELGPLGLEGLAELRGAATSLGHQAREWSEQNKLPPGQARIFLEAFEALDRLGAQEVGEVLRRAWEKARPVVADAASRFPFNRTARMAITPDHLAAVFEPKTGLVPEFVRGYLEPLSSVAVGSGGPSASVRRRLQIEEEVMQVARVSAEIGARLWDDKGPRKITMLLKPEPFEALGDDDLAPTALTLQLGSRSVRYFNQMPVSQPIEVDWSVDESAQLRVEYVNLRRSEAPRETALLGDGPYWRAHRILARASLAKQGGLRPTHRCEWTIPVTTANGARKLTVRMLLQGDPWAGLTLPNLAISKESWP